MIRRLSMGWDMTELWHTALAWMSAHEGPLAAVLIAAIAVLPFVALRAAAREHRRHRVRTLYAERRQESTIWTLRKDPPPSPFRTLKGASHLAVPGNGVSIAILPFEDFGTHTDHPDLVGELTAEIAALLNRSPMINVSCVRYERGAEAQAGMPLPIDAQYLLEGSVELVGPESRRGMRISVQLIEMATGDRVSTEAFEGPVRARASIEDDVYESIVGALSGSLHVAAAPEDIDTPTASRAAWALHRRTQLVLDRGLGRERMDYAVRLLDHACRIDPGFVSAKRSLARTLSLRVLLLTSPDPDRDLARARALIDASSAMEPDTARLPLTNGLYLLALGHADAALVALNEAVQADPNRAEPAVYRSWAELHAGAINISAGPVQMALDLTDERAIRSIARYVIALDRAHHGRWQRALNQLEDAIEDTRAFHLAWLLKGLVLALSEEMEEARLTFSRARRIMGSVKTEEVEAWVHTAAGPSRAERWLDAFKRAWWL